MIRNWLLPLGLAAMTALGAGAPPAIAHEPGRGEGKGHARMEGHGHGHDAHGGMRDRMPSMYGTPPGMMGGPGHMGGMMRAFDADGDGVLTPGEFRSGLEDRLAEFDADDSGTLSLQEFEALHSAMIREIMVDRFQMLDNDGDGAVTAEEMTAPADHMERMQDRRRRMPGARGAGMPDGAAGEGAEEPDAGGD